MEQFESGKFADVLRAFLNIDGEILRAERGFFWGRRGVIGFETQEAKSGGVAAGARARRGRERSARGIDRNARTAWRPVKLDP